MVPTSGTLKLFNTKGWSTGYYWVPMLLLNTVNRINLTPSIQKLSRSNIFCSSQQLLTCFSRHKHPEIFVSFFKCPMWTNRQNQFSMKCTLEWELRFNRVNYCTGFWQQPHAIEPKTVDQAQSCDLKRRHCLSFVNMFYIDFHNL